MSVPTPEDLCRGGGPVLIRGARVARPRRDTALAEDVLLAGGRVEAIGEALRTPKGARTIDGRGCWLLPGWIDLQLNDVAWMAGGSRPPEEHAARVREVLGYQARQGVTGVVLATLAAPLEELEAYLQGMQLVLERPEQPTDGVFLGALVEGTFMNPANCGAHNPEWILKPEKAVVDRLLATGAVKLLNMAPEVSGDALDWIRYATDRGVGVGAGHSRVHAARLRAAVDAGLRYAIHLGNGPTGSSLKAFEDGGMLEECLRNDRIVVTVILDGIHVHPDIVRDWIARKELERVIGVSDAAFALGAPEGEFEVLGIRGARSADGRYLSVLPAPGDGTPQAGGDACAQALTSDFGALFGSAVGMRDVFENALNLLTAARQGVWCRHHEAWPLERSVLGAVRMTSTTPATLLSLPDRGDLEPGGRGDALLIEIEGPPGRHRVRLRAVGCASAAGSQTGGGNRQ